MTDIKVIKHFPPQKKNKCFNIVLQCCKTLMKHNVCINALFINQTEYITVVCNTVQYSLSVSSLNIV